MFQPSAVEINRIMKAALDRQPLGPRPAPRKSKLPPITPAIGREVWFWPNGVWDHSGPEVEKPFVIDRSQALDATIVFVHNDQLVNLLVRDHKGEQCAIRQVYLRQPGCDTPTGFYCEWMPYQQAQAVEAPAVAPAADDTLKEAWLEATKAGEAGGGACTGCGLCMGVDLASQPDIAGIMMGVMTDDLTEDAEAKSANALLITTLTAAYAAILDGDLTMAGQLVDAALGRIERNS